MRIHLLGASTPTGKAFQEFVALRDQPVELRIYSRSDPAMERLDLGDASSLKPSVCGSGDLWISFAPIWLLASFVQDVQHFKPGLLSALAGVVACSSSSALTKRFASNRFDRNLVQRLQEAEAILQREMQSLGVPLQILSPTLIYGACGDRGDRNLSRLIGLMRKLPLLPLPAASGLRQPIHVSQLAAIAWHMARTIASSPDYPAPQEPIVCGGDESLSYLDMLRRLQQALPYDDPARRCRLIEVPQRLFFTAASPLQLISPKTFEAVLRMGADLSGFMPAHELLQQPRQTFPLLPLAMP